MTQGGTIATLTDTAAGDVMLFGSVALVLAAWRSGVHKKSLYLDTAGAVRETGGPRRYTTLAHSRANSSPASRQAISQRACPRARATR